MSDDDNRNDAGQFASAPEPVFGRAAVERDAGYMPYQEKADTSQDELTVKEAADEIAAHEGADLEDRGGDPLGDIPENVTLTAEQAADLLTREYGAEATAAEKAADEEFAAEIDKLRGEKPEEKAEAKEDAKPKETAQSDLDPDIEKALSNPKIQEALAQHVGEVEEARQQHLQGVRVAAMMAQASFMSQFPEFTNVPQDQIPAALATMKQHDPARAEQVFAAIQRASNIFVHKAAMEEQAARADKQQFQEYVKAEDVRFNELTKNESKETLAEAPAVIRELLQEYGVDMKEFGQLAAENRFLRSAAAQRVLLDAAKYRQIMKAPKPVAARRPPPPVARPGVSGGRAGAHSNSLEALNRQLDAASGGQQLKIARQILDIQMARG